MQEHISNNQEGEKVASAPKPFDPKDEARMAELEKKFGPKLEDKYVINGATVEIGSGGAVINRVPDTTPEGYTNVGQKTEEYTIELPVTITDPNASGDFKNVGRWSKYILTVDKMSGDVKWSSRVDRRYDEKQGQYNFDGPTYQIHTPEVEKLLKTQTVVDALKSIGVEAKQSKKRP